MKTSKFKLGRWLLTAVLAAMTIIATAPPACAIDEEYTVTTLLAGGTNNVPATSTNTVTGVYFNCTQHDTVGLQVQFVGNNASLTGNIGLTLAWGANASTNKSTVGPGLVNILVPANGTTEVCWITNMNAGAYGYGHITQTYSTNATYYATNLVIRVITKPIREGYRK